MSSSLVIANFETGMETDRPPFVINNDAFPVMQNAYVWRGRIKKKRGTELLGRLQRVLTLLSEAVTDGTATYTTDLLTSLRASQVNAQLVPGTITFYIDHGGGDQTIYTDNGLGSMTYVSGTYTISSGTIVYSTGVITLHFTVAPAAMVTTSVTLSYYPVLPVLGLLNFETEQGVNFPTLIAFDQIYSYQFNQTTNKFYDVSFYKITGNPVKWSGQYYQQFWEANFQGAMFVTNNKPGFHFLNGTYNSGTGTTLVTFNFKSGGVNFTSLVIGDILWFNEWSSTGAVGTTANINAVNGTVSDISDAINGNYVVTFLNNITVGSTGIVQMLTNSIPGQDGIRWYDGDHTNNSSLGWVNFAPPISNALHPQYITGCKIIIPFKDRLLLFGYTLSTSTQVNNPTFINRMAYSQNGIIFYTLPLPNNIPASILDPIDPSAWYQNVVGKGGQIGAPIQQRIITVQENEDVLLTGFESKQLKLIYTSDDSFPFLYQTINSELGSQNTFSGINLDMGALTIGEYGIAITDQQSAQRIDVVNPDQVFNIQSVNNADQQVTAIRDYRNEFVYFTYLPSNTPWTFPNQTFLYNYRDNTWAIFNENYTSYGTFRRTLHYTWATLPYRTWAAWVTAWNFGAYEAAYPDIIGGNQQGFVLKKSELTREDNSQYITNIVSLDEFTIQITSPNHCLLDGDFIEINDALSDTTLNGLIFQITVADNTPDTFNIPSVDLATYGTYIGNGTYRRLTNVDIRTKQFPIFWQNARKCRVGTQMFLMGNSPEGQVTMNMYTSQVDSDPSNNPLNSAYLSFSNILLTGPETDQPYQTQQAQIWHRVSNSFIGDTVQVGITLSKDQMMDEIISQADIEIYAICLMLYPGPPIAT